MLSPQPVGEQKPTRRSCCAWTKALHNATSSRTERGNVSSHLVAFVLLGAYGVVRTAIALRAASTPLSAAELQYSDEALAGQLHAGSAARRALDAARVSAAYVPPLDAADVAAEYQFLAWQQASMLRRDEMLVEHLLRKPPPPTVRRLQSEGEGEGGNRTQVGADGDDGDEGDEGRVLSAATVMHTAGLFAAATLYLVSSAFHAFSSQRVPAGYLLLADKACITLTLSANAIALRLTASLLDPRASSAALNALDRRQLREIVCRAEHLDARVLSDPALLLGIALACLAYYRSRYSFDRTWQWVGRDHYGDAFDSLRRGHVELGFGDVLTMLFAIALLQQVLGTAYAFSHFVAPYGALSLAVTATGAVIMLLVGINDLSEFTDARAARWAGDRSDWCASTLRRAMPTTHTVWHLAAVVFNLAAVGVREGALDAALRHTGCA
jgi:hypothetical protein